MFVEFVNGTLFKRDDNTQILVDKTGKTIIPCKWKLATSFSDGLAYVKGDDDKWVYIDKTGKVVSQ